MDISVTITTVNSEIVKINYHAILSDKVKKILNNEYDTLDFSMIIKNDNGALSKIKYFDEKRKTFDQEETNFSFSEYFLNFDRIIKNKTIEKVALKMKNEYLLTVNMVESNTGMISSCIIDKRLIVIIGYDLKKEEFNTDKYLNIDSNVYIEKSCLNNFVIEK